MSETPAEYNAKIIAEFRANAGHVEGMWEDTPLLLLHHRGARSGVSRVNPVAFLPDGRRYFIWAANGGASKNPDWYHNLKAHADTTIEVGSEMIEVVAEEASGNERERLFSIASARYPQLAEAAGKTHRLIPLVVLTRRESCESPEMSDRATCQGHLHLTVPSSFERRRPCRSISTRTSTFA